MATITFDTLKFANRLEKAGIPREHAQAEAEALAEVFEAGTQELATKADLREMKAEITGELKLNRWMTGVMLAGVLSLVLAVGVRQQFLREQVGPAQAGDRDRGCIHALQNDTRLTDDLELDRRTAAGKDGPNSVPICAYLPQGFDLLPEDLGKSMVEHG